jgi:hypothetical protein
MNCVLLCELCVELYLVQVVQEIWMCLHARRPIHTTCTLTTKNRSWELMNHTTEQWTFFFSNSIKTHKKWTKNKNENTESWILATAVLYSHYNTTIKIKFRIWHKHLCTCTENRESLQLQQITTTKLSLACAQTYIHTCTHTHTHTGVFILETNEPHTRKYIFALSQ